MTGNPAGENELWPLSRSHPGYIAGGTSLPVPRTLLLEAEIQLDPGASKVVSLGGLAVPDRQPGRCPLRNVSLDCVERHLLGYS